MGRNCYQLENAWTHQADLLMALLQPNIQQLRDERNYLVIPTPEEPGQEYITCPYADARRGHDRKMNLTSLRVVTSYYPTVTSVMSKLASGYKHFWMTPALTPLDIWRIWAMAYSLPILWLAMHPHGRQAVVPQQLSVIYKVSIGFLETLTGMIAYLPEADACAMLRNEHIFFEFLDHNRLLIGRREVCAGTSQAIMKLMKSISTAEPGTPQDLLGFSHDCRTHFVAVLLDAVLSRCHIAFSADEHAPTLDSPASMKPQIRLRRLRRDSILGQHYRKLSVLDAPLSLDSFRQSSSRHLAALTSARLEAGATPLTASDYLAVLGLAAEEARCRGRRDKSCQTE